MKRIAAVFVAVGVITLASCGGGNSENRTSGGNPAATVGTVAVAGANQFATFLASTAGTTQAAPASPISMPSSAVSCAADIANASVLVAYNNLTLVSFVVNKDSSATLNTTTLLSGAPGPMAEAGGRLIYAATTSGVVSQFGIASLNASGQLQTLPNQLISTPLLDVVAHPNGQMLVESQNPAALQAFSINATSGQLTALTPPLAGIGGSEVRSTAFVQGGAFLVVAEGAANSNVDVVSVNPTSGALLRLNSPLSVPGALFLAAHPNGHIIYALGQNAITVLNVDATGVLTRVTNPTPLPAGVSATAATVDRAGTTLWVSGTNGSGTGVLLSFGADANTGILTGTPLATTTLNFQPVCVFVK
jgi:hypothetical protein